MSEIKKVIRQEYLKCAKDPVHFMKKYCYIQHPQRGRIQFNLFPFQERVLKLFRDNPYSIVLKIKAIRFIYSICWLFFMDDDFL